MIEPSSSVTNVGYQRPPRGPDGSGAADRFCREHDELRNLLRSRSRHNQHVSATHRRRRFLHHARIAMRIMQAA
jgi:putative transposase